MKGYVLSLLSVLLFSVLFLFVQDMLSARNKILKSLQESLYVEKIGFVLNDLQLDIRNSVALDYDQNDTIMITDNFAINKSQFFSALSTAVSNYANKTNANISIAYFDPLQITIGNAIYSSYFDGYVKFLNQSGDTNVQFYNIQIVANQSYINYTEWSWQTSGLHVVVNYSDPTSAFVSSGYVDPTTENLFVINYSTGNVTILVGPVDTRNGSFALNQSGQLSLLNLTAGLSFSVSPSYNIIANISSLAANFYGPLPA